MLISLSRINEIWSSPLYGELHISYRHHLFLEETDQFAYPEHKRCAADDEKPVEDAEGGDIEEFAAHRHYEDLADNDHEGNHHEAARSLEMECRFPGFERTGVEHVPELEENENREEHREFVGSQCRLPLLDGLLCEGEKLGH